MRFIGSVSSSAAMARTASAVPSVDASSTTMISLRIGTARTRSISVRMVSRSLKTGMMTDKTKSDRTRRSVPIVRRLATGSMRGPEVGDQGLGVGGRVALTTDP